MDVQYFINKFEAIPEEKWCIDFFEDENDRHCVNGHCGVNAYAMRIVGIIFSIDIESTEESEALYKVLLPLNVTLMRNISPGKYGRIVNDRQYSTTGAIINNGDCLEYQQDTPKQRILAALRDIQSLEQEEKAIQQTKQILEENGSRRSKNHEVCLQA